MSTFDARDLTTKFWFNPIAVGLTINPDFAAWLSRDTWLQLSGAPSFSDVTVDYGKSGVCEIRVKNPMLFDEDMVILISQMDESDEFLITNAVVSIKTGYRARGLAARILWMEAQEAARHKMFRRIRTYAAGDYAHMTTKDLKNRLLGHYGWARMGFDGEIPLDVRKHCVGGLSGLTRVNGLMATLAGRDVWSRHAQPQWLEFGLHYDSQSWITLNAYLAEKGILVK